ncbi:hypothetical protein ABPG74_001836 [Tetrahymena malaccensis]
MDQQQIFKLFLYSNLLKIDIQSPIYKQDVQITPEKFASSSDREAVFLGVRKILHISHDMDKCIFLKKNDIHLSEEVQENPQAQWICYSSKQMYQGQDNMTVLGYQISIKQILQNGSPAFITTNKERQLVLNNIARQIFGQLNYHEYQKGFFNPIDPPNAALSKDKSVVYQTYSWNGLRPKTIEFRGKVYLEIETTPVRFLRMNLFQVINKLEDKKIPREEICNFLVGRTVKTSYFSSNLYYEILEVDFNMTPDSKFVVKQMDIQNEGDMDAEKSEEELSYYTYVKNKYRINIRDRVQPMIRVRPLHKGFKSELGSSQDQQMYLIPSLCNLFGQISQKGFIDDNVGTEFYFEPYDVYEYTNQITRFLKNSTEVQSILNGWQIKIGEEFEQIGFNYLKLSSLQLKVNNVNESFSPNDLCCKRLCHEFDGYYKQLFCSDGAFTKFTEVNRWVIFVHSSDSPLVEALVSSISQFKLYYNYPISEPKYYKIDDLNIETWTNTFNTALSESPTTFALIIMNSELEHYHFYKTCKQAITVDKGICCSLIKASTLQQYVPTQQYPQIPPGNSIEAFASRFLSQMQAKLGESPWLMQELPYNQNPCTMIGFSVLRQRNARKIIVAGAASINKQYSKYLPDYRVISEVATKAKEDGTSEIVELSEQEVLNSISNSMKDILQGFLNQFATTHKINPTWVIIIRDGILINNAQNEKDAIFSMMSTRRSQSENKSFHLLFATSRYQTSFRTYNFYGSSELNANIQNVTSPGTGAIVEKQFNKREFYLYTQKIVKNCPFSVLYNVLHIDKFIGLDEQSLLADFQDLVYNTYVLNYTYHTKTTSPACVQNAYKLAEFVKMFVTPAASQQNTIDLSNLRVLCSNYKLFFI